MELTIVHNNATLSIAKGETITITLTETPTSGYAWELSDDLQVNVLELKEVVRQNATTARGAARQKQFTFLAVGVGESVLTLLYKRSFNNKIDSVFAVTITVEESHEVDAPHDE